MPKAKDRRIARGRAVGMLDLPEHMPMPEPTGISMNTGLVVLPAVSRFVVPAVVTFAVATAG